MFRGACSERSRRAQHGSVISEMLLKLLREQPGDSTRLWWIAARAAPFWSRRSKLRQSPLRPSRQRISAPRLQFARVRNSQTPERVARLRVLDQNPLH